MAQDSDELNKRTSMTRESIINSCKKNKLYLTPYLNDVLYLHYQGYQKIENLDEFTGLKCLWLECNAISEICGLDNQKELRCLYLHNNFIRKIENLQHCIQLDTLNLSHNYVKSIENCNSMILPQLNTLNLSHNSLSSIDGLEELAECKTLSVLDISHNRIEDVLIVKILSQMPELRVLTMTGNPVVNDVPSYRKTLTVECKNLTYLDSRPIFDKDRACAEAWKRGGYEEEKREKLKWDANKQKKIMDSVRATLRFRQKLHEKNSSTGKASLDSPTVNGDNEEVSQPQPNIEEIIERVEKSIELYPFDETPDFDDFESVPDSMEPDSVATPQLTASDPTVTYPTVAHVKANDNNSVHIKTDVNNSAQVKANDEYSETEIQSDTHINDATSAFDNDDSGNTNRNSPDCTKSSLGTNVSMNNSIIEISDVASMNILNICMNVEPGPTVQAHKSKPIIEVLSDVDARNLSAEVSVQKLETHQHADLNKISNECSDGIVENKKLNQNTLHEFKTNDATQFTAEAAFSEHVFITAGNSSHELSTNDPNINSVELNKLTKSSAITFFCENLDDLKGMESDSDRSFEDI